MTKAGMSEQQIAGAVVRELEDRGATIWTEIPIVLDAKTVSMDIVCELNGDYHLYECKQSLTSYLERQVMRGLGYFDRIYAAVAEPGNMILAYERRLQELKHHGIGVLFVNAAEEINKNITIPATRQQGVSHALIIKALCAMQQTGSGHNTPAGSAGVKRVKPDRWDPIRATLTEMGYSTLANLKVSVPSGLYSPADWRAFTKAVYNHEAPGIRSREEWGQGRMIYELDGGTA